MATNLTLDQIFVLNPITTNAATDLIYFSRSPYTTGNDAAMLYSSFAAQFQSAIPTSTTANLVPWTTTTAGTLALSTYTLPPSVANGDLFLAVSGVQVIGLPSPNTAAVLVAGLLNSVVWTDITVTGAFLQNRGGSSPVTSVYSLPSTTLTINELLFASSSTAVTQLATANSALLTTNTSGVPSLSTTGLPATAVAVKTDQVTATSTALAVTPSVQQNHPSAAKAYGYVTITATILTLNSAYNCSASRSSTGVVVVTLTVPMTSVNYVVLVSIQGGGTIVVNSGQTASSFTIQTTNITQTTDVDANFYFACFGTQ